MGVAGGQIETAAAGRFFELSEEESERMAARTTRRTRHVPTSLLTHWQKPHSGPALCLHSFLASAQNSHQCLSRTCTRTSHERHFHPILAGRMI